MGYIYSYLLQVIGLGLTPRMLHYAKSILCYLARTCPSSVIALLLRELSSVEIISGYLEPISPPPYFQVRAFLRLQPVVTCVSRCGPGSTISSALLSLSPTHSCSTTTPSSSPGTSRTPWGAWGGPCPLPPGRTPGVSPSTPLSLSLGPGPSGLGS